MTTRRRFLSGLVAVLPAALGVHGLLAQDAGAPADSLPVDLLRDPSLVGRLRDSLTAFDNDPVVVGIERRLRCTCGCTLDIYTCRTTDFSCTFSPALHREVVAKVQQGDTPEQIVAALVAREGQAMLMAPPARGFNLAGYLVPGLTMTAGALGLAAWLSRRRVAVAGAEGVGPVPAADAMAPLDADQQARLERALDDVEA